MYPMPPAPFASRADKDLLVMLGLFCSVVVVVCTTPADHELNLDVATIDDIVGL